MPKIGAKILGIQVPIGKYEYPLVTTNVPASMEVGDKITVTATVKRADNTTPIEGINVDFFVEDSNGTISLGSTDTNASGIATTPKSYFVAETEEDSDIEFYVQVKGKSI
jgi:hypothetical protein